MSVSRRDLIKGAVVAGVGLAVETAAATGAGIAAEKTAANGAGIAAEKTAATGSASVDAAAGTLTAATKGLDIIVIGAGVFGAWTAWHLQRKGHRVLLIDAWGAAHSRASSGGETRLIRTEYAGNAFYSRWAWESLAEWQALSRRHESPIFHPVGALYIYPKDVPKIDSSIAIQRSLGVPIEKLVPPEMARRWPQINFDGIAVGVLQPTMGALMARRSVQTLVGEFVKAGGQFRLLAVDPPQSDEAALRGIPGTRGEALHADRFIFACGPSDRPASGMG